MEGEKPPSIKKKERIHMYLDPTKICPGKTLFDVPHQTEPMSAHEIAKAFPKFALEMNGGARDRCLSYFYKKNRDRNVYEFNEPEDEEEVAELMGVEVYDESKQSQDEKEYDARELTPEEHQIFRDHIADIREKLQFTR